MAAFSAEFARDAERAREILEVFARHGFALQAAVNADVDTDEAASSGTAGQRLRAALAELGTTWVKLGQSLSLRPDLVGADVARELESLQASVPPDAPGLARARVERELRMPVGAAFASFDERPFGSGSVAQAHRAVLKDGSPVVVKVLHDGADEKVASDLGLMRRLAAFAQRVDPEVAQFNPVDIVEQFSKLMTEAVDLRNELRNMQRLREALADLDWLVVPRPFAEYSTTGVLTMEFMPGAPLGGAAEVEAAGWNVDDLTAKVVDAWLTMIFSSGFYHADPHPGNFLIADADHLVLLDFGDVGFVSGPRRDDVAGILLAVASHDVAALTDVVLDICAPPGQIDTDALEGAIEEWLANYLPQGSGSRNRDLKAAMNAGVTVLRSFGLSLPADITMLLNVVVRLEGFGRLIGSSQPLDQQLEPFIQRFVHDENSPQKLFRRAIRSVMGWRQFARDLPRDISGMLAQLRSGQARVEVNFHDSDGVADKVVDGLVAAAALVGAAQLLSRGTPPQVKGVSVLGLVGAGLAVGTLRRIATKRSDHQTLEQRLVTSFKRLR